MHPKELRIQDFTYDLPDDRIAFRPVHPRDSSQLLVYKQGDIYKDTYHHIRKYLPEKTTLVFNDTRVINSRIYFPKETGAVIEVFCLEPYGQFVDYESFLALNGRARWKCMIGKASKWKNKYLTKSIDIDGKNVELKAELVKKLPDAYVVELSWSPEEISHAHIIDCAGETPLPPYIKRSVETTDLNDYQTVYSDREGSVAAPTAGLHFTEELLADFNEHGISSLFTTLHVGAGTFKPVKSETMKGHIMHEEWMVITIDFLEKLKVKLATPIISVGTTSTRTLESIYWMGNKVLNNPQAEHLGISQWEVYDVVEQHEPAEAIDALIQWIKHKNQTHLIIETGIIIAPSYEFKIVDGLITNFHLPQSTLLLLVAAFIGKDWKEVYHYALEHGFRFLSYGDGSLLLP